MEPRFPLTEAMARRASSRGATTGPDAAVRIVCFGDSITATRGSLDIYAQRLDRWLAEQSVPAKVINAGVGGHTTDQGRQRFVRDVLEREPDLVVILFGANDAAVDVWKEPPATQPRVDRETYRQNLAFFIEQLKQRGAHVILMTPAPFRWTPGMKATYGKPPYDPDDPDGFNVLLKDYARIVREVAREHDVPLVDLYQAFGVWANETEGRSLDDLYLDGMHPNDAGQAVIFAALLETLRQPVE